MTKPPETRRVEALPAKWRKELDDYQAETDERDMTPEHAAFFNGKLQASYELDAALASGADTPDWRAEMPKQGPNAVLDGDDMARYYDAEERQRLRRAVRELRDEVDGYERAVDRDTAPDGTEAGKHFDQGMRAAYRHIKTKLDRLLTGPAQET